MFFKFYYHTTTLYYYKLSSQREKISITFTTISARSISLSFFFCINTLPMSIPSTIPMLKPFLRRLSWACCFFPIATNHFSGKKGVYYSAIIKLNSFCTVNGTQIGPNYCNLKDVVLGLSLMQTNLIILISPLLTLDQRKFSQ